MIPVIPSDEINISPPIVQPINQAEKNIIGKTGIRPSTDAIPLLQFIVPLIGNGVCIRKAKIGNLIRNKHSS